MCLWIIYFRGNKMKTVFEYLINRPLLLSGLACSLLSVVAFYLHITVFITALILAVLMGFMIYRRSDARIIFSCVLILVFCISCINEIVHIKALEKHSGATHKAEMILYDITHKTDTYYIARARVKRSDRLPDGTMLTVFYKPQSIKVGDSFTAEIKLRKITKNEYKADSYSNGVYLQGNLTDIKSTENNNWLLQKADEVRSYIKTTLMQHMDYREAATMSALIFGERDYFTNDFYDGVRKAGVSHVMVVSGMHLAIIISFAVKLMEKIFYNRFVRAAVMVALVGFLSLLCGFTMSILRAGITYIIMATGIVIDRKGTAENSLGGALSIILICSEFAIFNISLQLSLLSTFGILVVALPIIDKAERRFRLNFITRYLLTSCTFSLSAYVMTLPVTIYNFGCISTVSIISNLLISSAVTYALYLAFAGLIFNLILPFLADFIFALADVLTKYINYIIVYMGNLSFAVVDVPECFGYIVLAGIFFIMMLLVACKKRSNMLKLKLMKEKIEKEGGKVLNGANN